MLSRRPYILRAIYEWIEDNLWTPQLLVDAEAEGVVVPDDFIVDGKIVLNISQTAVQNLMLANDEISFSARFQGETCQVFLPLDSVIAIYSRETGMGSILEQLDSISTNEDEEIELSPPLIDNNEVAVDANKKKKAVNKKKSNHLRLVK